MGACGVVTGLSLEHVRDACWTDRHGWCPAVRKNISTKQEIEGAGERSVNDTWCRSGREGGPPGHTIQN